MLFLFENYGRDFILIVIVFLFLYGSLGIYGLRRNLILVLISLELILFSANLGFVLFSNILDDSLGQLFALLILSLAATEVAIGLSLLIVLGRIRGTISMGEFFLLRSDKN
jgi:NADH-quinone oxidoreductase subunit K